MERCLSLGDAYVTGNTLSSDFPRQNALFPTFPGTSAAFVTELSPAGSSLVYSTFLGGSAGQAANGIAVDAAGNAYVAGRTNSTDFPRGSQPGFQASYGGGGLDGFVAELATNGTALVYSTYIGGSNDDEVHAIALDSNAVIYIAGYTNSSNFPVTAGAFQGAYGLGGDAFMAKIDATQAPAQQLLYSTYLGGNNEEVGSGIAVDSAGGAHVTGKTSSTNFPTTPGAFQTSYGGGVSNGFVAKFDPTQAGAASLVYSTYVGGAGDDEANAIAVDAAGDAYVTGFTTSTNYPTTVDADQRTLGGSFATNIFVTELNVIGSDMVYSSYFGGNADDEGAGIAVDSAGNAYVAGFASSTGLATPNAFQQMLRGAQNAIIGVFAIPQIGIVNVIPTALSGETNQDDEPSIAVNPVDPRTVAMTTFSRVNGATFEFPSGAWGMDNVAPVWVSTNSGRTWNVRGRIPQPAMGVNGSSDQTLVYNSDGSQVYGAFLGTDPNFTFYVRLSSNPDTMDFAGGSSFASTETPDQPWIQAAVVDGQNRVYVAFNDIGRLPANPNTASVIVSTNGGAAFQAPVVLDGGPVVGQDSAPVRVAVTGNSVYAAFVRRTGPVGMTTVPGDIVVMRDDRGGVFDPVMNPNPFRVFGELGSPVESGAVPRVNLILGQERLASDLSIAIDPITPNTVYVA